MSHNESHITRRWNDELHLLVILNLKEAERLTEEIVLCIYQ